MRVDYSALLGHLYLQFLHIVVVWYINDIENQKLNHNIKYDSHEFKYAKIVFNVIIS